MFRRAIERATKFTFPVVQYGLTIEGKCTAGTAAFIVINEDGWIITAAHVMKDAVLLAQADSTARQWESKRDAIRADQTISGKERGRQLSALGQIAKKATRRGATAWAFPNVNVVDIFLLEEADLAVARLDGFNKDAVSEYPVFKNPKAADFLPGASLCKLGYPFIEITPTYDEANNRFEVSAEQGAIAYFPIEGMFTRTLIVSGPSQDRPFPVQFVETSSPGLRGQSGGPTFDADGTVWAIQSQTRHQPLGFSPEIKVAGKIEKEHQFLNVGMGIHVETVVGFLNQIGIKHNAA